MPSTRIYGWPYEALDDQPGVTLHGGDPPSSPILAEEIEKTVASLAAALQGHPPETVIITASGNFVKGDYPWATRALCRMVAGGGAGGGAHDTSGSQASFGAGGGGGEYAEIWLEFDALSSSEAVTIGAGGTGNAGATGGAGGNTTGFGVTVNGGSGGLARVAFTSDVHAIGGSAGGTTAADGILRIPGDPGSGGVGGPSGTFNSMGGNGGSSRLGPGGLAATAAGNAASPPSDGGWGGGGAGEKNGPSQGADRAGAAGRQGVIILTLFAR